MSGQHDETQEIYNGDADAFAKTLEEYQEEIESCARQLQQSPNEKILSQLVLRLRQIQQVLETNNTMIEGNAKAQEENRKILIDLKDRKNKEVTQFLESNRAVLGATLPLESAALSEELKLTPLQIDIWRNGLEEQNKSGFTAMMPVLAGGRDDSKIAAAKTMLQERYHARHGELAADVVTVEREISVRQQQVRVEKELQSDIQAMRDKLSSVIPTVLKQLHETQSLAAQRKASPAVERSLSAPPVVLPAALTEEILGSEDPQSGQKRQGLLSKLITNITNWLRTLGPKKGSSIVAALHSSAKRTPAEEQGVAQAVSQSEPAEKPEANPSQRPTSAG